MIPYKIVSPCNFRGCNRTFAVFYDRFLEIFKVFIAIDTSEFLFVNNELHNSLFLDNDYKKCRGKNYEQ